MSFHHNGWQRFMILLVVVSMGLAPVPASAIKIKLKIKKPRITVGTPKVYIPSPEQALKNVVVATETAAKDVNGAVGIAVAQTGQASGKAINDAVRETGRIPGHLADVGDSAAAYLNSYKESGLTELEQAHRRVEQGKLVDMLFHTAVAPMKASEGATYRATQESTYVNSALSVAAGAYGGTAGTAAYAAWQTYRASDKNVDLAIKAGIIAALTKEAMGDVSKMDGSQTPDLVKKMAIIYLTQ